jgi:hypothetical protein
MERGHRRLEEEGVAGVLELEAMMVGAGEERGRNLLLVRASREVERGPAVPRRTSRRRPCARISNGDGAVKA